MSLSFPDGSFDPFELPSWTAALIVSECGLMDVGLEIKEINPQRFCLIFKRHLTFLSCVSSLSWMSARGRQRCCGTWSLHPGPGPGPGPVSEGAWGLLSEWKTGLALITERTPQRWGGYTHSHFLQGEMCDPCSIWGKTPIPQPSKMSLCVCVHIASMSGLMTDTTVLKTDQLLQHLVSPAPAADRQHGENLKLPYETSQSHLGQETMATCSGLEGVVSSRNNLFRLLGRSRSNGMLGYTNHVGLGKEEWCPPPPSEH